MPRKLAVRTCIRAIGGDKHGAQTLVADLVGLTRSTMNMLWHGTGNPSPETAIKLVEMARDRGADVTMYEILPDIYPLKIKDYIYP